MANSYIQIVGAALTLLLSVAIYNTIKLLFVVKKLHLFPFTKNIVSFSNYYGTFLVLLILGF
jgi:hypothetical protein